MKRSKYFSENPLAGFDDRGTIYSKYKKYKKAIKENSNFGMTFDVDLVPSYVKGDLDPIYGYDVTDYSNGDVFTSEKISVYITPLTVTSTIEDKAFRYKPSYPYSYSPISRPLYFEMYKDYELIYPRSIGYYTYTDGAKYSWLTFTEAYNVWLSDVYYFNDYIATLLPRLNKNLDEAKAAFEEFRLKYLSAVGLDLADPVAVDLFQSAVSNISRNQLVGQPDAWVALNPSLPYYALAYKYLYSYNSRSTSAYGDYGKIFVDRLEYAQAAISLYDRYHILYRDTLNSNEPKNRNPVLAPPPIESPMTEPEALTQSQVEVQPTIFSITSLDDQQDAIFLEFLKIYYRNSILNTLETP